ncbi:MAG: 4'-phosphopantetheinyl transferase superfamily protein [Muribaculaceae bacterium]|nr:4'-phosphopantetheinyl transferase superfamily protein [Muribaculaceae bacterium]
METEFIYWRYDTSAGVRVEQLSGGEDKSSRLWKILALQVFGENSTDRYREVGHYPSGAPFIEDSTQRISISHTPHFMVVASLPRTPEAHLEEFNLRTAMGIDTERADREQARNVVERIMNEEEKVLMDALIVRLREGDAHHAALEDDKAITEAAVLTWTIKEALYKAALVEGMDFAQGLRIKRYPEICSNPLVKSPEYGEAEIFRPDNEQAIPMRLFSYRSEMHIVTIAFSPKCATFKKS